MTKQHPIIRQPRFIDPAIRMRAEALPTGMEADYVRHIALEFQRMAGKVGTLRQYHGGGVYNCTSQFTE